MAEAGGLAAPQRSTSLKTPRLFLTNYTVSVRGPGGTLGPVNVTDTGRPCR